MNSKINRTKAVEGLVTMQGRGLVDELPATATVIRLTPDTQAATADSFIQIETDVFEQLDRRQPDGLLYNDRLQVNASDLKPMDAVIVKAIKATSFAPSSGEARYFEFTGGVDDFKVQPNERTR